MNKPMSLVASVLLLSSTSAIADTVGFELGTYKWTPDYSGEITGDDALLAGDTISLENDLGFSDEDHQITWLAIEHPVPFIPNFKVVISDLEASADSTITRQLNFGGEVFQADEDVSTLADMSNTEYTLYYELLDNWINLDAGLTLRQYDGMVTLKTPATGTNVNAQEDLDFTIPLLYLKGRVDLPLTGVFVDGTVNIIGYDGDSISDTEVSLGYESEFGLGAKAGYRTFSMDVEESDFTADLEYTGAYVSVFYHF